MINYSTKMFENAYSEAKYLTLGVGATNLTFSVVAVSTFCFSGVNNYQVTSSRN